MLEHRLWSIVIVFFAHGTSKTIEVAPISLASPELSLEFLQCNYCNRFRYAEYRNRYVERQISHQRMRTARLIRSTRRLSEKSGQTEVFSSSLICCSLVVCLFQIVRAISNFYSLLSRSAGSNCSFVA